MNPNKKPQKNNDFLEFMSSPPESGFLASLPVLIKDVPENPEEFFFEFINDIKKTKFEKLFDQFVKNKNKLSTVFYEAYWHIIFFSNTVIDSIFVWYKKKHDKDWQFNLNADSPKEEIAIEERGLSLARAGLSVDKAGGQVEFKTLALLSGRMFTAGGLRTVLTILGISISIGVILFLVSFGYGLQKTVLERITTPESLLSLVVTLPNDLPINGGQIDEIRELEEVDTISTLVEYNGNLEKDGVKVGTSIFIIDEDYFLLAGLISSNGEPLKIESSRMVVSSAIAILLGFELDSIVGTTMNLTATFKANFESGIIDIEELSEITELENKTLLVSDIVDDDSAAFVYVLNNEFKSVDLNSFVEAKVKVNKYEDLTPLKDKLVSQGYVISSISDTVEETRKIFRGIQAVLGFFGLIALIISAIGMLNIMTIVLLERTQEIGVMKAIGASSGDIWKIVITDAIIIGFLGGVGGIVIGVATSELFNLAFKVLASRIGGQAVEIFQMPPGFILIVIVFSAIIGFLTGVWPAIRASHISPLEAIKYK